MRTGAIDSLETATQEMIEFERKEGELRKKDHDQRAAELRPPLDNVNLH